MDTGKSGAELMWRLARVWWVGFKVFCRWVAFWIVLSVLWLPAAGGAYLLGDDAGPTFVVLFAVLCGPIVFYLTSRYLLLLGDDDHAVAPAGESPAPANGQEGRGLRKKIVISTAMAYLAVLPLTLSPDPLTGLTLGMAAALFCGVPLLILARFRFLKAAFGPIHTLVCALVCLTAVLLVMCLLILPRDCTLIPESQRFGRFFSASIDGFFSPVVASRGKEGVKQGRTQNPHRSQTTSWRICLIQGDLSR